jgi:hypothetical protein
VEEHALLRTSLAPHGQGASLAAAPGGESPALPALPAPTGGDVSLEVGDRFDL